MSFNNNADSAASDEQPATTLPSATANTKPKLSLINKRKADELDIGESLAPKSDKVEKGVSSTTEKSAKRARVLKLMHDSNNSTNELSTNELNGMGMFDSATPDMRRKRNQKKATSALQHLQATSEVVAATLVASDGSPTQTFIPQKTTRKKAEPKKLKSAQQDLSKGEVPNGQNAPAAIETSVRTAKKRKIEIPNVEGGSAKYPVAVSDTLPEKKPKRASPRTKKASGRKIAAEGDSKNKKTPSPSPQPPLLPATISKEVANKVNQVRKFVENEDEQNSKLDRHLNSKHLIDVPESSLISAVIRMRAHYQIDRPLEQALSEVEDAIVERFQQEIGQQSDIDWVTIDATKRTKFEERIFQKIARHGLDEVNLLEIELEMFRKDHLKRLGEYDDQKEIAWDADRFLRAFAQIWDRIAAEEEQMDSKNAEESDRIDSSTPQKEEDKEDVGAIDACATPIQPV